jgi:hypothetical protein
MDHLLVVLDARLTGKVMCGLQQTQLAGTGDGFGSPLDL